MSTQLVERIIFATDRDDLISATNALDRVLLWNYYNVPHAHPRRLDTPTGTSSAFRTNSQTTMGPDIESWWIDAEKEKVLAAKYKGAN